MPKLNNRFRLCLSALLFGLTLVLAYRWILAFSGGDLGHVVGLIGRIPASLWLVLVLLTCGFYLLDWIRFRSVLQLLGYPLSCYNGFKLTCVSYFVTSLTPTADLHTPAMVFMLSRNQVPVPQALAASISKSIYMTLWICLISYLGLFFDRSIVLPEALRLSLPLLSLPLLVISLFLGLIVVFPQRVMHWLNQKQKPNPAQTSFKYRLLQGLNHSAEAISRIGSSMHRQHAVCHLASIGFLLIYVGIGWLLAEFFGFSLSWLQALTIFSTSLMVAYLSPIPGSIGITELATSYMLNPQLSAEGMAVSLTLRLLCWYLVALPGGLVLAQSFRQRGASGVWPSLTD